MADVPARTDLDEAEAWMRFTAAGQRVDPEDRDIARVFLAEYDRRGAALAERDAEIARLRAAVPSHAELVRVIADPGQLVPRGDNYRESIPSWSARAVLALLAAAPAPTEDEGDELRADCGIADHEWVPCRGCQAWPKGLPCACTGDPCCQRQLAEVEEESEGGQR